MGLLTKIHADILTARKAVLSKTEEELTDDQKRLAPHSALLVTLLSEINAVAKADGNRQPTDADADKAIRSSIKTMAGGMETSLTEARNSIPDDGTPKTQNAIEAKVQAVKDSTWFKNTQAQSTFLQTYVPPPLDKHHLTMAVTDAAAFLDTVPTMKEMGRIMKRLNEIYPGQINGALVREILESGNC